MLEAELKVSFMALVAALITAGAAAAGSITLDWSGDSSELDQGFITREWTWTVGTATTTFTAYGPSDQVNALDPQESPLHCTDCELASSIHFESGDEVEPTSSR